MVDLLVSIRTVGEVKHVTLRNGSQAQVREVVVFDQTHSGIKISLWEPEIIMLANNWRPRLTILFMTDMKIEWNNFMKAKTAQISQRTLITENPIGAEVENLRHYAMNAALQPSAILDSIALSIPNGKKIF